MSDIEAMVAWLNGVLDDEEMVAKDADLRGAGSAWYSASDLTRSHHDGGAGLNDFDAAFIVAHDPAHVLNVVAAHRAILDWAERWMPIAGMGGVLRGEVERLVRMLAAGYASRDGYRVEWGQR